MCVICCGCQGVASLVYLSSSDMYKLINYSSFVNWLAVGLSVVALLYFRWKRPDAHRPIKVIHFIGLPQTVTVSNKSSSSIVVVVVVVVNVLFFFCLLWFILAVNGYVCLINIYCGENIYSSLTILHIHLSHVDLFLYTKHITGIWVHLWLFWVLLMVNRLHFHVFVVWVAVLSCATVVDVCSCRLGCSGQYCTWLHPCFSFVFHSSPIPLKQVAHFCLSLSWWYSQFYYWWMRLIKLWHFIFVTVVQKNQW